MGRMEQLYENYVVDFTNLAGSQEVPFYVTIDEASGMLVKEMKAQAAFSRLKLPTIYPLNEAEAEALIKNQREGNVSQILQLIENDYPHGVLNFLMETASVGLVTTIRAIMSVNYHTESTFLVMMAQQEFPPGLPVTAMRTSSNFYSWIKHRKINMQDY